MNLRLASLAVLLSALGALSSSAQVNVQIDLSDLSHATFTATGEKAYFSDSSLKFDDGVTLAWFFTDSAPSATSVVASTFGPAAQSGIAFYSNSATINSTSLNFTLSGSAIAETFDSNQTAFTGTMILDLSDPAFQALLPSLGATGDIQLGYSGGQNPAGGVGGGAGTVDIPPALGTWEVTADATSAVPEPSNFLLGLVAIAGALGFCWHRRRVGC